MLTIPASTVYCERGFPEQNIIKDIRKSLDALMRISLNGPEPSNVDWHAVYKVWKDTKSKRILEL